MTLLEKIKQCGSLENILGRFVNGHGCFYDSLANLLILLDDEQTAKKVLENSKKYYLKTGEDGFSMGTQTIAVRELTEGVYRGRSIMHPLTQEHITQLETVYADRAQEINKMIDEEFRLGNITLPNSDGSAIITFPGIMFINGGFILPTKYGTTLDQKVAITGHAAVQLSEDTFIDGGKILNYDICQTKYIGFLTIEKVGGAKWPPHSGNIFGH